MILTSTDPAVSTVIRSPDTNVWLEDIVTVPVVDPEGNVTSPIGDPFFLIGSTVVVVEGAVKAIATEFVVNEVIVRFRLTKNDPITVDGAGLAAIKNGIS